MSETELEGRISRFIAALKAKDADFSAAAIVSNINQYYFTGTMQDGILLLRADGEYAYFVRRSFDCARAESPLKNVFPMASYRDAAEKFGSGLGTLYIEEDDMPVGMLERLRKYFSVSAVKSAGGIIKKLRSVKSEYELEAMRQSGKLHNKLLCDIIPNVLKEGMSEAQFASEVYSEMLALGHHGLSRFHAFGCEVIGGHFAFGDGSVKPSRFNGPAGTRGLCAAAAVFGRRDRFLKKGDLVFADVGFGVNGYHTDKTQIYSFGAPADERVASVHNDCLAFSERLAFELKAGAVPSVVYADALKNLPESMKNGFMGTVKFIGHGTGLAVDEFPVIAKGFDEPLEKNMTIALEPKVALPVGLVGVEETYLVTESGGVPLTGGARGIMRV